MLPKLFVSLFMLMLSMAQTIEMDLGPTNLKSNFSVKCFGIMQSLLQDIAAKNEKISQIDEIIEGKETQLASMQSKYNQVEIKLAVADAVVREKERQLMQKTDLCNTYRNNSLVKDDLLNAYRTQVQDKATQIEQLHKQAKEQAILLNSCTSNSEAQIAQIKQLETVAQANQLKLDETIAKTNESAARIEKLLVEAKKTNHKSQDKSKDEQIVMLKSDIENLQTELKKAQAQLSDHRSQLDKLQPMNCYWFGNSSDIHTIVVPGISPFEVLCDSSVAGPGWTVIQRRIDGSENFYRNWSEYRNGFGDLHGEFFIGMENLYRLTRAKSYELYVYLESFDNSSYYARYADFSVGSEDESYALKVLGEYSGSASDGLVYARNRKFSTYDVDNDKDDENCAIERHGAWWYDRCGLSNLNGQYFNEATTDKRGILWLGMYGLSFKSVRMMLRPT